MYHHDPSDLLLYVEVVLEVLEHLLEVVPQT
jgi:hypothetical protein